MVDQQNSLSLSSPQLSEWESYVARHVSDEKTLESIFNGLETDEQKAVFIAVLRGLGKETLSQRLSENRRKIANQATRIYTAYYVNIGHMAPVPIPDFPEDLKKDSDSLEESSEVQPPNELSSESGSVNEIIDLVKQKYSLSNCLVDEFYSISSYLLDYGAGRTIKTFSLLPGEKVEIRMHTFESDDSTSSYARSILDSSSKTADKAFNNELSQQLHTANSSSSHLDLAAKLNIEGHADFGSYGGSASLEGSAGYSTTNNRELMLDTVGKAIDQHAQKSSRSRDVSVDTTGEETKRTESDRVVERKLHNVNISSTQNFIFRQVNQEFASIIHLTHFALRLQFEKRGNDGNIVDIKNVGVPLHSIRDAFIYSGLSDEDATKNLILIGDFFCRLTDENETPIGGFVSAIKNDGQVFALNENILSTLNQCMSNVIGFKVNRKYNTALNSSAQVIELSPENSADVAFTVAGIVVGSTTNVMRTDGVVVDVMMGQGLALDEYSVSLQTNEIEREVLLNQAQKLENKKLELALKLIEEGDPEKIELYKSAFPQQTVIREFRGIESSTGRKSQDDQSTKE